MQHRPIREILNTDALRPKGRDAVFRERRGTNRFACKLPAALGINGKEYPVECLEISQEGLRIQVHALPQLIVGQRVNVRTRIGEHTFADSFDVVRTTRTAQGAINVHLRLQAPEPTPAPAT